MSERRVLDLIEELIAVNALAHQAEGEERERLFSRKQRLISMAIIVLSPKAVRLQYQRGDGRSQWLLVTLMGCGRYAAFHLPVECLTEGARTVVKKTLGR